MGEFSKAVAGDEQLPHSGAEPSGRGGRMNPPPPAVSRDDDGLTALSLRHHGP
jgi:hypothetical protein